MIKDNYNITPKQGHLRGIKFMYQHGSIINQDFLGVSTLYFTFLQRELISHCSMSF